MRNFGITMKVNNVLHTEQTEFQKLDTFGDYSEGGNKTLGLRDFRLPPRSG